MQLTLGYLLLFAPIIAVTTFLIYIYVYVRLFYIENMVRILQIQPLFIIPRGDHDPTAEEVHFPTSGGAKLYGVYFHTPQAVRKGVILFGIEFGSDCWSARGYTEALVADGYDVFTYAPRGQKGSDVIPGYTPMPWITTWEVEDCHAAINYLLHRPDADPKGIGFFGVSKGANAGLAAATSSSAIRCIVTDGAFGLLSVMVPYMKHWIKIYNRNFLVHGIAPRRFYYHIAEIGARRAERRLKLRLYRLDQRMKKIKKPVFMIHGALDSYIKPEMSQELYERSGGHREYWLVPKARHNQAITLAKDEYRQRLLEFFNHHMPSSTPKQV
ncbi:MAG: prolyl oligopeptidase family serine peptidase [Zavarzinella sp.]